MQMPRCGRILNSVSEPAQLVELLVHALGYRSGVALADASHVVHELEDEPIAHRVRDAAGHRERDSTVDFASAAHAQFRVKIEISATPLLSIVPVEN